VWRDYHSGDDINFLVYRIKIDSTNIGCGETTTKETTLISTTDIDVLSATVVSTPYICRPKKKNINK